MAKKKTSPALDVRTLSEAFTRLAERVCKLEKEQYSNVIPILTAEDAYRERFGHSNPLNNIYSIAAALTTYKGSQSAEMEYLTRVADDLRICVNKIHYDAEKAAA